VPSGRPDGPRAVPWAIPPARGTTTARRGPGQARHGPMAIYSGACVGHPNGSERETEVVVGEVGRASGSIRIGADLAWGAEVVPFSSVREQAELYFHLYFFSIFLCPWCSDVSIRIGRRTLTILFHISSSSIYMLIIIHRSS